MTRCTFELYIDGKRVCALRVGPQSDFPWFVGSFEPLEHFHEYEKFFHAGSGQEHLPDRWLREDLLKACGVDAGDLIVEDEGYTDEEPTFLHALVIRDDGHARWRIGPEPIAE